MKKIRKTVWNVSKVLDAVLPQKKKKISAVIVAAGNSARMGEYGKKQVLLLAGKPVILHTLLAFEACRSIDEIIVVTDSQSMPLYSPAWIADNHITKLSKIVPGGATRAESVANGFQAVSDDSDFVAIHDGARCLITPEQIDKVVSDAVRYGAAIAGCRSTDTLKKADKNGFILETPDRNQIWRAQTPQIFKTKIYRIALALAKKNGIQATDDAVLVKEAGFSVKITETPVTNMKITTPDDIPLVEQILKKRGKSQ